MTYRSTFQIKKSRILTLKLLRHSCMIQLGSHLWKVVRCRVGSVQSVRFQLACYLVFRCCIWYRTALLICKMLSKGTVLNQIFKACRLHVFVHENWILISANVKNVYPVTMLLISTGFFIVTLVEILVSRCRKNKEVFTEKVELKTRHFNSDGIGSSINCIWWISNDRKPNWIFCKVRKSSLYNVVWPFCSFNFWRSCYRIARR